MSNIYQLLTLAAFTAMALSAQNTLPDRVAVNPTDSAAGRDATLRHSHGLRSHAPAARALAATAFGTSDKVNSAGSPANSNSPLRFPGDLSNNGGAVVPYAQSHAIYMNPVSLAFPNGACTIASCWGDPEGFLRDLGKSNFIHITDQYVNTLADNRYTVGRSATVTYLQSVAPFTDNDILSIVHAVAATTGQTGYGHIYHVFLPPGQDVCQSPGVCASNAICAYHGSANFFDLGHILYTVEPDQLGFGCAVAAGSPNGARVDSTNSVLSHEMFETITDPDFTAWFNATAVDLLNEEIGDECSFINAANSFDVPTFKIGTKVYAVQREYDNIQHACATKPD